jgi:hypothetical protein
MALKMPVKMAKIKLDGDYEGFEFTARTNYSVGMAEEITSGDVGRMIDAFAVIVTDWNFVDEDGKSLGDPSDRDSMKEVPLEMLNLMSDAIVAEVTETDPN